MKLYGFTVAARFSEEVYQYWCVDAFSADKLDQHWEAEETMHTMQEAEDLNVVESESLQKIYLIHQKILLEISDLFARFLRFNSQCKIKTKKDEER